MNKILLSVISLTFLFSCNSSRENELIKKENELLKRELEIQKKENSLIKSELHKKQQNPTDELIESLTKLLNKDGWDIIKVDKSGNFSFDMGSASSGRISGNLKDVIISIEHKPERPGCADICPPMEIIHFQCINGDKCVTDPAFSKTLGYYSNGSISFGNLLNGKKTYQLLSDLQKTIKVQ